MPKQQQLVYLSDEQFQTLVAQGSITVDGQTVEYSEDDIYVTPQEDAYIKPATGIPASDLADDAVPVRDVQVNGSSVLQNGIANIDVANLDDIVAIQDTQPTSEDNKIWLPETLPAGVEIPTVAEMNAALAGKIGDVQVNGQSIVQNGAANVPIAGNGALGVVGIGTGISISSAGNIGVTFASDNVIKVGATTAQSISPGKQHASTFYGLAKAAGDTTQSQSSNAVGSYTPEAKAAIQAMLGVDTGIEIINLTGGDTNG